jgi:predicted PurR-regulated permease PerM
MADIRIEHEDAGKDADQPRFISTFTRRTWTAVSITVSVVVLLLLLAKISQVLLIVFAGILLAIFLRGLTRTLMHFVPIPDAAALALVGATLIGFITAASWLLAPSVGAQLQELTVTLPEAGAAAREYLEGRGWGRWLIERSPNMGQMLEEGDVAGRFFGVFSTAIGAIANTLFILIIGIYLSINPSLYWKGIVLLFPKTRRDRARTVLFQLGDTLWQWLIGQFITMAIIGTLTWIGLSIIGVPLALALGVIAGLFEFVPIIGPWAAAVPGVLVALAVSPTLGLYAAIMYLIIQQIESNVVSPLVARQMVSIPPALTITATIIAAVLFGLPGMLLATPMAVALMVLIRMVYIEDVLGDPVDPVPPKTHGVESSS